MIAEVKRRSTPAPLLQFLRQTFPRRGAAWWTRIRGPLPDKAYAVNEIMLFDDGGFFARSCVFFAYAPAGLLEGHSLPSGRSFGLFALSGEGVSYLTRNRDAVEAMLRREARPLEEGDALVLARFFTEALDRKGNDAGDVLPAADTLSSYKGGPG